MAVPAQLPDHLDSPGVAVPTLGDTLAVTRVVGLGRGIRAQEVLRSSGSGIATPTRRLGRPQRKKPLSATPTVSSPCVYGTECKI